MTPKEAVNHREKVIKVDKGLAVTNVALAALNQGIKHAGPGPAKETTASDVVVPTTGLAGYALSRHAERQQDIANGVNPDLPPDQLHAARVAAESARRAAASPLSLGRAARGIKRPRPLMCRQRPGETASSTSMTA
jgi:hypothetical protein